jgi:cyclophilin family peptidyl-prolyl cis-trans isomerase
MRILTLLTLLLMVAGCKPKTKNYHAVITTPFGDVTIRLYNSTPIHRDNFVKLAREGYYDYLLFHRVVKNFVVQGGDPKSRDAHILDRLGEGHPGYLLDPEIGAIHLRGAVGAARMDDVRNPERKSNGSQFYIVVGGPVSTSELDQWEATKGIKYTAQQRELYMQQGGLPFLDMEYTVFGEVVEGMDAIDRMSLVATANGDRPTEDIRMLVKIIEK